MSENYQYNDCEYCGQRLMEHQIHNCRQKLMDEIAKLKTAMGMYESLMSAMQRDAEKYLMPDDTQFSKSWFVSRILYHIDGPMQKEVQSTAREALDSHDASCDCGKCYDKAHREALADRP